MNRSIFKAYDVRGIYGADITDDDAQVLGEAIFDYLKPAKVAVGHDARLSAPEVCRRLCKGLASRGVLVTELGMVSTDMTVFAAGHYDFDLAISVTASHNPKEWIGLKLHKRGGIPVGGNGEMEALADIAMGLQPTSVGETVCLKADLLDDWIEHVLSFVDVSAIRPLKIVVDAGNGVAGPIVAKLAERLPITVVPMYFEPDGNFPHHLPSPIEPENTQDLRRAVVAEEADLGMAFDGDADRMFLIDEKGVLVTGSETTAMVMEALLSADPTQLVLFNAICGWNVRDVLSKYKAQAQKTKVGHAFIKNDMRRLNATFAGEHSGHYFYKENFCADSALITAVLVLELLSKKAMPLSVVLADYRQYCQIPETNFRVKSTAAVIEQIARTYASVKSDRLDGLTCEFDDWWFNVRPSNTEPLLRLNVEAKTSELLSAKVDELTALISSLAQLEPSQVEESALLA